MGELALDGGDSLAYHPSVDLELAFAFAEARSDAATHAIRGEMRPHAAKARVEVLVLREAHLKSALFRGGMEREDVKDECRAIDDLDALIDGLFEVRLLRRGELIVEYDQVRRI